MVFYKFYLENESGEFTSYYMRFYKMPALKIGQTITWRSYKHEEATDKEEADYWAPLFGCLAPEDLIPMFKWHFPVTSQRSDIREFAVPLTVVECEGELRTWKDPCYGISPTKEGGERWFDTQTIVRVVKRYSRKEVAQWIRDAYAEFEAMHG